MAFSQRITVAFGAAALLLFGAMAALIYVDRSDGDAGLPAHAQTIETEGGIEVQGEGQVALVPDTAGVLLGVQAEGEDLEALRAEVNERMDAVIDGLQEDGVDERDIQTVSYDISVIENERPEPATGPEETQPDRGQDTDAGSDEAVAVEEQAEESPEIIGYAVQHDVRVVIRDIDATGSIIDNALDNGANNVGRISFEVDDREGAVRDARALAVEDARDKAEHLADLNDITLGAPIKIDESSRGAPIVRMDQPMAEVADDAGARIEPGESVINVTVDIVYRIE